MILLFINKFILAGNWTEVLSNLSIRIISWATLLDKLSFLIIKAEGRKKPINRKSPDRMVEALCSRYLFSQPAARQLSSAYKCLTSVFGMGTGGPTWQSTRTHLDGCYPSFICQMLSHLTTLWVYQIFADLSTLFFRNLVTHTGFEPMLTAWEAAVLTTWPMGHWCTFRDSNPGPTD